MLRASRMFSGYRSQLGAPKLPQCDAAQAALHQRPDQPPLVLFVVENLVDDDASAEDGDDIFAFDDFNAVGIGEG